MQATRNMIYKFNKFKSDPDDILINAMPGDKCLDPFENRVARDPKKCSIISKLIVIRFLIALFTLSLMWLVMLSAYTILYDGYVRNEIIINEAKQHDIDMINQLYSSMDDTFEDYVKLLKERQSFLEAEMSKVLRNNAEIYARKSMFDKQCGNIPANFRSDCHPEDGASQLACTDRGCCWNPVTKPHCRNEICSKQVPLDVPYCYYPRNWPGYEFVNSSRDDNEFSGFLKRSVKSAYESDIPLIKMETTRMNDDILRVKIYDPTSTRYEPPLPKIEPFPRPSENTLPKYIFEADKSRAGFKIKRAADNASLFDSIGKGGFIFADQFLQLQAILPSHNIYGLGEHRSSLKLNTNWQSFTMFNKDQPPTEHANLYGSHPFYLVIEESGSCHGVLLLNSNAMDVILQPAPAITFRTIGGIFDMYFFMGPTPADVIRQYSDIVGKPILPPYWSLGFHLCKYGYQSVANTRAVWNRTRSAGIPFDTQWNDIDYMDKNNDFTYDDNNFADLPKFIDELHSVGMHYIPIIDAGVSASEKAGTYPPYDEGIRDNVFVKDGDTKLPFIGKVWNKGQTAWPDFTHPNSSDYYLRMMRTLHQTIPFDGIWLDMNEPSNFYNGHLDGCSRNKFDYPQYVPNVVGGLLATKTLCMNAQHYIGPHYDLHNLHGITQVKVVNRALTIIRKKRPFIISRSSWVGSGHFGGHWTGDVYSSWHDLQMSIPQILMYSLFQMPMVGADMCGFDGNTTEHLCNRWMQLGAFYPFARNHNSDDTIEQDPVVMGDLVVKSSRKALLIRYRFLPYLYTLFAKAHIFGDTVARPLFFEFVNDPNTYDVDTQFLWGSALMIIPVLEENQTEVTAYLPHGLWYDFYSKHRKFSIGVNITVKAPLDTIPLMVRGGSILPAQTPSMTTTQSRKNNFELLAALDEHGSAIGDLYWDDGDSLSSIEEQRYVTLDFTVANQTLTGSGTKNQRFTEDMILGKVSIMGIDKQVDRVFLNNNEISFIYDENRSYLNIKGLSLNMKESFGLSWTYT